MKFSIKDFVGKCDQTEDLVRFTEKILDGRLRIKMLFTPHFCSLSMKTSTLFETNRLETFQMFGKMIWLSIFLVSDSRS